MKKNLLAILCFAFPCAILAQDATPKAWYERVTLKGDVRLRGEYTDKENDSSRWRGRIRARAQAEAQVIDTVRLGLGLRTGGDDPVSGNQSLGDAFSSKEFMLDLAYLKWAPAETEGLVFTGGKMNKPWVMVSDLVWDSDVNPEGAVAVYTFKIDKIELLMNAGGFLVQERHNAQALLRGDEIERTSQDTWLFAGQLGLRAKPSTNFSFLAAATYYYYDHLADMATLYDTSKGYGNSTTSLTNSNLRFYRYDYRLAEALAEIGFTCPLTGMKTKIYGQYVRNTEPDDDRDGFLAGIKFGELKAPGAFMLGYNYRELQKDAVVGAFADADCWGGGTDGRGHKIEAGYQLADNWSLGASWFINESAISTDAKSFQRMYIDLNAAF